MNLAVVFHDDGCPELTGIALDCNLEQERCSDPRLHAMVNAATGRGSSIDGPSFDRTRSCDFVMLPATDEQHEKRHDHR